MSSTPRTDAVTDALHEGCEDRADAIAELARALEMENVQLRRELALAPLEHASNMLYFHSRELLNKGQDREPILVHVRALNAAIDAARRAE